MRLLGNLCPLIFAALILTGCASVDTPLDDGYQFGDLGEWRAEYCEASDPLLRAALLALAARKGIQLSANGICTEPTELLDAGVLSHRA